MRNVFFFFLIIPLLANSQEAQWRGPQRNGNKLILLELERYLPGINPHDGEIFITRGYDMDAVMLTLSEDGRSVNLKWKNQVLDTHIGGVVAVNGYIFGSNWQSNTEGKWVCLDWDTGQLMYEQEWYTKGAIIHADGHLYCTEEKRGNVALVKPDPSGSNPAQGLTGPILPYIMADC